MIDLTLDMEQYDCPFIDTTAAHDVSFSAVHWAFDTATETLETRMLVESDDRGELSAGLEALRAHDGMDEYGLRWRDGGRARIDTVIDQTAAMKTIREGGGYVTGPFHIEAGSERWHVGFDSAGAAEATLAQLDRDNEFDVIDRAEPAVPDLQEFVGKADAARTLMDGCEALTAVERDTLTAAVERGYFATPREATLGDLAAEFDVSKAAVSKNLRRGQRKLFAHILDAVERLDVE
ncbi:MAG: helix-turn-helix domain-containing protein [Halobaculum sp.]